MARKTTKKTSVQDLAARKTAQKGGLLPAVRSITDGTSNTIMFDAASLAAHKPY
jgi:hypothetical protein